MRDAALELIAGLDPQTRAALAMSSDLGTLFLADHWRQVLGHDPLHGDGLARWADEAMRFYAVILPTPDTAADDGIGTHPLGPSRSADTTRWSPLGSRTAWLTPHLVVVTGGTLLSATSRPSGSTSPDHSSRRSAASPSRSSASSASSAGTSRTAELPEPGTEGPPAALRARSASW